MKAFERFAPLFMLWVSGFGLGILIVPGARPLWVLLALFVVQVGIVFAYHIARTVLKVDRLRVYFGNGGDGEWVVAWSEDDAANVWQEYIDANPDDDGEPIVAPKEWHAVADDYIVDITDHEPSNEARQTCAKWAKGGRRFLCTNNAAKE